MNIISDSEYIPTKPQNTETEQVSNTESSDEHGLPCVGDILLGKYKIAAKKDGGFGIVFYVVDLNAHIRYAVKTYPARITTEKQKQFTEEAKLLLNSGGHPNIVKIVSFEVIDNRPYLFMEYASDGTLRDQIGSITPSQAVIWAYQICLGMEHITNYREKLIHCDLKPENILVTEDRMVKIADFGLAVPFNPTNGVVTRSSEFGTLPYMAPERFHNEIVDERSDIFSYGILFYEMLTGELPYSFCIKNQNLTSDQWREHLKNFYAPSAGLPRETDDFRYTRWPRMEEINEHIERAVKGCIFINRRYRWSSFHELRLFFETKLKSHLKEHYKTESQDCVSLHRKALALQKVGELEKSLAVFNRVLRQNPNNAEVWRDAALALLDVGMTSSARRTLWHALERDPNLDISNPKLQDLVEQ